MRKIKHIQLTKGQTAIVDDDLFPVISKVRWYCYGEGPLFYAVRNVRLSPEKRAMGYMHHAVVGYPLKKGFVVDHINRNSLDNRRSNLRIIEHKLNGRNRKDNFENFDKSKPGTVFKAGKWQAQYYSPSQRRTIYLGIYPNQEEAYKAHLEAVSNLREGRGSK